MNEKEAKSLLDKIIENQERQTLEIRNSMKRILENTRIKDEQPLDLDLSCKITDPKASPQLSTEVSSLVGKERENNGYGRSVSFRMRSGEKWEMPDIKELMSLPDLDSKRKIANHVIDYFVPYLAELNDDMEKIGKIREWYYACFKFMDDLCLRKGIESLDKIVKERREDYVEEKKLKAVKAEKEAVSKLPAKEKAAIKSGFKSAEDLKKAFLESLKK